MSTKEHDVEKIQAAIDTLNVEIGNLRSKISSASIDDNAKLAHEEHMSTLRQQRDDATSRLAEIQVAGGNA